MLEALNNGLRKAKTQFLLLLGIFLLCVFVTGYFVFDYQAKAANPPQIITYQGKLLVSGSAASTTQAMYFYIYDADVAGNLLYTASGTLVAPLHVSTTPSNGLFSVNLGDTAVPTNVLDASIFQNNSALYLEVKIGTQTLTPRKRLTATPYSFNSLYLGGVAATSTASSSVYIPISASDGSFELNISSTTIATSTFTGVINAQNGLISSVSSTFSSNLHVMGQLNASSSLLVGTTAGTNNFYVSGNNTYIATTSPFSSNYTLVVGNGTSGAIAAGGNVVASHDNLFDLGSFGNAWRNIYASGTLYVGSTSIIDSNSLSVVSSTVSDLRLSADGVKNIQLWTNGSERVRVDSNGNVGIGSSTPNYNLSVNGTSYFTGTTTVADLFSNPGKVSNPIVLHGYVTSSQSARDIEIKGDLAYIINDDVNSGLEVLNISEHTTSTFVGALTGVTSWFDTKLKVRGNYAYITDQTNLAAYDISDPQNISLVSSFNSGSNITSMDIQGNYAYIGDVASVLSVIDISNPKNLVKVGQLAGLAELNDMKVVGKYVYYLGVDNNYYIIDISNPANPVLKKTWASTARAPYEAGVQGSLLYVAAQDGLVIIDISDPSNPVVKSQTAVVGGMPASIVVSGDYTYLGVASVLVFNTASSTNPILVSSVAFGGGQILSLSLQGNYLYAVKNSGVYIIDVSGSKISNAEIGTAKISNMSVFGQADFDQNLNIRGGLSVGNSGFLLNGDFGMNGVTTNTLSFSTTTILTSGVQNTADANAFIFNAKNFDASLANYILKLQSNGTDKLAVRSDGGLLLNSSSANMLGLFYVDSVGNVSASGTVALTNTGLSVVSSTISDLRLSADGAKNMQFWTNGSERMRVDSSGKVGIGTSTPSEKLQLYGGNFLLSAGNPTEKSTITSAQIDGAQLMGPRSVYVSGEYAYVVSSDDSSFSIINVSNPASSTAVGYVRDSGSGISSHLQGTMSVYVSGEYAYVVSYSDGSLSVIDISNPTNPIVVGALWDDEGAGVATQLEGANSVYVSGKYAYVTSNADKSLSVIDISNPTNPTEVGVISDGGGATKLNGANSVYVSGKYAYVTSNIDNSLSVIDISNPTNPTEVGVISDGGGATKLDGAWSVYVSGKYAYVASYNVDSLSVIDISNPTNPTEVGVISDGGGATKLNGANSVYVSGKYAYVTSLNDNSLSIIDISGIDAPSANIGSIESSVLTVNENVNIGNNLSIRNGLNVGSGGILSQGAMSIFTSSTGSNTDIFSVYTSSTDSVLPVLVAKDNGNIGVGTSSPYARLSVVDNTTLLRDVFAISTSTNGLIFKVDSYGQTWADAAYTSPAADYAEYYYTNDVDLVKGEVVCLDDLVDKAVKRCTEEGGNIMGVVSTNPSVIGNAHLGYETNPHYKVIGMLGQVPVKVSALNGVIKKGDKLTSSGLPGVAVKALKENKTLGMALEDFIGDDSGVILALVDPGWNNQLYQGLSIDTENSIIKIGDELAGYNLDLYGNFAMKGNGVNKLSFSSSTLFESQVSSLDGTGAFIFNAANFSSSSTNNYVLSLRSSGQSVFSVQSNGDLRTVGDIYAKSLHLGEAGQPGDLAEKVDIAVDDTVEAGDVVIVDPNAPDTYRRSSGSFEQAVAGVVSTNPTIVVGNGRTDYTAVVAMVGRVPVKVSTENGSINRGDLLVTASTTGYAMKYNTDKDEKLGMVGVIGVALEPLADGKGKIMTLIRTGWAYNRNQTFASLQQSVVELASAQALDITSDDELEVGTNGGQLVFSGGNLDLQGGVLLNVASIAGKNDKWAIDNDGRFITKINTSEGKKEMYAMQSPVSEFVFSSSSQLVAGEARIDFDNILKEIIDFATPLKISVTLTSGEAKGVYVSAKDVNGFVVKELQSGNSSATFDWVVVAKRKNVDGGVENLIPADPAPVTDPPQPDPVVETPAPDSSSTSTPPLSTENPTADPTPVTEPPQPDPTVEPLAPDNNPVSIPTPDPPAPTENPAPADPSAPAPN